ncbi:hypothetical protein C2845_PM04G18140 [Panicum miliaceum]|uniref:Uncharacterized protein n=1 Tax=Panicum miliaceum TaxID=4540 RepID=A0A3L6QPF6_PANMI|nr:hypothetical protein C2845_PM04G18140 [Panicum miliaceum]
MELKPGLSALVTGGASGIGKALCIALARKGVFVTVVDFSEENGREVVSIVQKENKLIHEYARVPSAIFIKCDVTDGGGVVMFTRSLAPLKRHGIRVNVLCPEFVQTNMGEQVNRVLVDALGGFLKVEDVVNGAFELIEDESKAGACLWISKRRWMVNFSSGRYFSSNAKEAAAHLPFDAGFEVLKKEFPRGVDIIYESVGGETFDVCLNALAVYGRLIVIGMISQYQGEEGWKPQNYTGLCEKILGKSQTVAGFFLIQYAHLWQDHLEKLFNLYASGKLKVFLDPKKFLGVASMADAVEYLHSGRSVGKKYELHCHQKDILQIPGLSDRKMTTRHKICTNAQSYAKRKGRKEAIGLWKASQPVPTRKGPAAKLEPSHSHDPLKLHLFSGTRGHIPFISRKKKEGELHSNSRIKITGQASLNGNTKKPEA